MGRNKYSADEIKQIAKLLRLKNASNRAGQKQVRHDLRTQFDLISLTLMSLERLSVRKNSMRQCVVALFRYLMMLPLRR